MGGLCQGFIEPVEHPTMKENLRPALAMAVGTLLRGEHNVVLWTLECLVQTLGLPLGYGVSHVVTHQGGAFDLLGQPLQGVVTLHQEELLEGACPEGPHARGYEETARIVFHNLVENMIYCGVALHECVAHLLREAGHRSIEQIELARVGDTGCQAVLSGSRARSEVTAKASTDDGE